MQPARMNLNLFTALQAILSCRTLTEAARSVHLTQSAMSTSLRKLRDHFDDPIISYSRGHTELTPLGEALRPKVAEMLQLGRDMLMLREQFDPATSSAVFRLATIDSLEIVLLPHLLRLVTAAAPHVTIVSAPTTYSTPENIFKTGADVVFVRDGLQNAKLDSEVIYSDEFVCIVGIDHPLVDGAMSIEHYRSTPHAALQRVDGARSSGRDSGFGAIYDGIEVAVTTRSFAALAHVVANTGLIGVIPRRLAVIFANAMPVKVLDLPVRSRRVKVLAQWQGYRTDEPGMRWLLGMIREAARQLP